MRIIRYIFIILLAISVNNAYASVSNKGKEFYFSFGKTFPNPDLTLYISGEENTRGLVKIEGLQFEQEFEVLSRQQTKIVIPSIAQDIPPNKLSNYGLHITAGKEIVVYAMTRRPHVTDAFMALPVNAIGNEYIVSIFGATSSPPYSVITGAYDNTRVTITPSKMLGDYKPAGVPFDIILNKSETYMVSGNRAHSDLTGTIISASAPISVVSGTFCSYVGGVSYCDHLVEQLPPVSAWGKKVITVPLATRLKGDLIRILSSKDNTEVLINSGEKVVLNKGEFHEGIYMDALVINANEPILVTQFSVGQLLDNVMSDPFMMVVPPVDQFLNSYNFISPKMDIDTELHFINIVVESQFIESIILDNQMVDSALFTHIGSSKYSGAKIQVETGAHEIMSLNKFGLFVYGFRTHESYGYPGGMSMDIINNLGDKYPPNIMTVSLGSIYLVKAGDSEDVNLNGVLDIGEDTNFDNIINSRTEDLNGNGQLDNNEDANSNGILDKDSGILSIELDQESNNLKLELDDFVPGVSEISFSVALIDISKTGSGIITITDFAGNKTEKILEINDLPTLKNVEVRSTINTYGIEIIPVSFKSTPTETVIYNDKIIFKWNYDEFQLNQKEDLSYSVVLKNPLASESRQVTKELIVNYTNLKGEQTEIVLGEQVVNVLPTVVSVFVDTDKNIYTPDEEITAIARIKNISLTPQEVRVRVVMMDVNNDVVDILSPTSTFILQGEEEALVSEPVYAANRVLSGDYKIVAQVLNKSGDVLDYGDIDFKIVPDVDNTIALQVGTDKNTYTNNEQANINFHVRNLSSNNVISSASLELLITDSRRSKKSIVVDLPQMLSGATYSHYVNYDLTTDNYSAMYYVDAIMRSVNGDILAADSTSFLFQRNLTTDIEAKVTATFEELNQGDEQECLMSLSSDRWIYAQTKQVLISPDNNSIISSVSRSARLSGGGAVSYVKNINTVNLEPGIYTCLLEVKSYGSDWKTMAYDNFEILGESIKLSSYMQPGIRDRLLVLLDSEKDTNEDVKHIPALITQRTNLKLMLENDSWRYVITESADDFTKHMRTGDYQIYLIGSEQEKLSEQSQKELRESIYSGSGLIVSGLLDQRMHSINESLGIKFIGNLSDASGLTIYDAGWSQIGNESFNLTNGVTRAELVNADLIASYIDDYGATMEYPAMSVSNFGNGRSVFLGFDAIAEAAASSNENNFYNDLIKNAIDYAQNKTIIPLAGTVYPLTITVLNDGKVTDGRVIINIENMDYVDSDSSVTLGDNKVIWDFSLDESQEISLTLWIRLPSDQFLVETIVQSYDGSAYTEQQRYETYMQPQNRISISEIIDQISFNKDFNKITKWLNSAQKHFDSSEYNLAISYLIKASDECAKLDSYDDSVLTEVRANIGLIIKEIERSL